MAGIAAIYDPLQRQRENHEWSAVLAAALQRPDGGGTADVHADGMFALGLAPAPRDRSSSPAWNDDRTICAVFHGELFATEPVRRTLQRNGRRLPGGGLAELAVRLYEAQGDSFVETLDGSFVLALWDGRQRRLLVANDRYGLRPLYTVRFQGRRLWASSPKAFLTLPGFPAALNPAGMADLFCLGIPQAGDTIIEGVHEVEPASLISCRDGRMDSRRYWEFVPQEEETGTPAEEYRDELIRLLRRAAERQCADSPRVGMLLSGGLDSRIVLSMLDGRPLRAFTFGMPGSSDAVFAARVAHAAHVPHRFLEIEPGYLQRYAALGVERTPDLLNCNQYHGISVYDAIAAEVDVLITGSSGEDVFGHYRRDPHDECWAEGFSIDRYYGMKTAVADQDLAQLMAPATFARIDGLARKRFHVDLARYPSRHVSNMLDRWSVSQQQRRLYNRLSALFPEQLAYRPFFFDNELMDFVCTIPPSLRWGEQSVYRAALVRAAPDLAALPATTTQGLPLHLGRTQRQRRERLDRWRRKLSRYSGGVIEPPLRVTSYVHYEAWLRVALRPWVTELLTGPATLERGVWNPDALPNFLDDFMQGRPTMKGAAKLITAMISFELWCRRFLDTEAAGRTRVPAFMESGAPRRG